MEHALQAVLFDMDGVVTDTAGAHAAAWQRLFDEFLSARPPARGEVLRPFDIALDYRRYVDGKPRYDGVAGFLASRGIELPWGQAGDAAGAATVCGLGNRKNQYFRAWLARHRVHAFAGSLCLIEALRAAGIRCAVFSASRNAGEVLRSAQVIDRFDARVDGGDIARLGLPGKPDPAMLREAAARLALHPRQCAVVEDALAGVQAAHAGGFGCVVGVDRSEQAGQGQALRRAGAHRVVQDLAELSLALTAGEPRLVVKMLDQLPSVQAHEEVLRRRLAGRRPLVFLDYDGTLTPIVEDHTQALLADAMRAAVGALAAQCTVAIVSGRDLAMLRRLVRLDTVVYAGSHGFEIAGPAGRQQAGGQPLVAGLGTGPDTGLESRLESGLEVGLAFLPDLDAAEQTLRARLADIEGHSIERKRLSIAVHFRQVAAADQGALDAAVDAVLAAHPRLARGLGKKVYELQPRIDWNKGRAVQWLIEQLGADSADTVPVYVGDDLTDEHAFRALACRGLCIAVRDGTSRPTAADLALDGVDDVRWLLQALTALTALTAATPDRAQGQGAAR